MSKIHEKTARAEAGESGVECLFCGRLAGEVQLRTCEYDYYRNVATSYICEEDYSAPDDGPCWDDLGPIIGAAQDAP